jgi:hypothetical protein
MLQAFMRARGEDGIQVLDAEAMAQRFGVVKGTYDAVALPKINAYQVDRA